VGSGMHGEMTGAMLANIEPVLLQERPDLVLVYGDTNSTLAGALAAVKLHIPVVHVEAGLRSFNRKMPEEINRVVTDHVSNLLFCPTDTAVANLEKEGIATGVFKVGDVMYDAFLAYRSLAKESSAILDQLGLTPLSYCLATVHRQENTEDTERLLNIFTAFDKLATAECLLISPLHPRTRKALVNRSALSGSNPHLRLIDPVSYLDLISLESQARAIFTDSGGIQKEAFFAQVPCITLRDETEWVETLEVGWNRLAGATTARIIQAFHESTIHNPDGRPNYYYGRGNASERIVQHLISFLS
jgi:UDP-GlcNAc3NAcA epimerase